MKQNQFQKAVKIYEQAAETLRTEASFGKSVAQEQVKVYNNISICFDKMSEFEKVVKWCTKMIEIIEYID